MKEKSRSQFMTPQQRTIWSEKERQQGRKIPRTHENCMKIFGGYQKVVVKGQERLIFVPGPARPGKTAKDRARR